MLKIFVEEWVVIHLRIQAIVSDNIRVQLEAGPSNSSVGVRAIACPAIASDRVVHVHIWNHPTISSRGRIDDVARQERALV